MEKDRIVLVNVYFSYNHKVVISDLSLHFVLNEKVCVLGDSGCGKSTLGLLIGGFKKPLKGEIINSTNQSNTIFTVFQDYQNAIFPWLTIKQNILLSRNLEELLSANLMDSLVRKLFPEIRDSEFEGFLDRYPNKLSGGQKQRVQIARALISKRKLIILDEADSSLDYSNKILLAKTINEVNRKDGTGFIIITHDLEFASLVSDRVFYLTSNGNGNKIISNKALCTNLSELKDLFV